jgi:hypothetical protein
MNGTYLRTEYEQLQEGARRRAGALKPALSQCALPCATLRMPSMLGGSRQPGIPAAPSWLRGWRWIGSVEKTSRAAARPHGPAAVAAVAALAGDKGSLMTIHVRGALREREACFPHRASSTLTMQENCALATVRRLAGTLRAGGRTVESGRPTSLLSAQARYT